MIAAAAVEDEEAADPLALDVPDEEPEPVVVEERDVEEESDALEVMVDELLPVAVAVVALLLLLPVAVEEGALVDEAVPEPAVAL